MGVREIDLWDMVGSYPACPLCQDTRVVRDAWAHWNGDRREWELSAVFEMMFCGDCTAEISPLWRLDEEFRTMRVRRLNDAARRGGDSNVSVVMTAGVTALGEETVRSATNAVAIFEDFSEGNDPHGEHDFGAVDISGQKILWKIDYFDLNLRRHSPDKANPEVTQRVLTIMLASEY